MEAVIFIGLQAAGKSTFYRQRFIDSYIRLNLDMLRTRHREQLLFRACLEAKQPVVIDNTNPRISDYAHRAQRLRLLVVEDDVPLGYAKRNLHIRAAVQSCFATLDAASQQSVAVTLRIARNTSCSLRRASLALQAIISSPI